MTVFHRPVTGHEFPAPYATPIYVVFHARVILDLYEIFDEEINFEQVEGDFDSFQGRWVLEQLGNHHTRLKYIVETKLRKDTFLSEAIVEEVIYEDLPSNLCAIRNFVEKRDTSTDESVNIPDKPIHLGDNHVQFAEIRTVEEGSSSPPATLLKLRPKVPGLQRI